MTGNDDSKVEQIGPHQGDLAAGFGWDFVSEVWSSRRFVVSSIIAGLILGGTGGYLIPKTYTSKIQVKAASIEKYDRIFPAIIAKDENVSEEGKFNNPSMKIVDDTIVDMVNSPNKFSTLSNIFGHGSVNTIYDFDNIYQVKNTSPARGLEKFFIPGYEISLSLKNKNELIRLTGDLVEELTTNVNDSSLKIFKSILETNSKLNDLNFELARKKHEIDSNYAIESIQNSIDVAKVGGFSKPIISTQLPVASQIPLQNAVPRYFFGYEMLEEEKKQTAVNAKNETKVPGYSDFVTQKNRLAALSNFLTQENLNLIDVQVLPELKVKNGIFTKIAVAIGVTLLSVLAALSLLAFRVFQRKMGARSQE